MVLLKSWNRLLRFSFRLLYNDLAWTYDAVSWSVSLGHWRKWQRTTINLLSDKMQSGLVLELAHGTGNLQLDLAKANIRSIGIDLSHAMGQLASRKLTRMNVTCHLIRCSALHLPLPPEIFSAIISTFPTEFIFQESTLAEAYRVLRPGGKVVIVLSGMLGPASLLVKLIEWLYAVTGQDTAIGNLPLTVFNKTGFEYEIRNIEINKDMVIVLDANKPGNGDA